MNFSPLGLELELGMTWGCGGFNIAPLSHRADSWMKARGYGMDEIITPIELQSVLHDFNNWNPAEWKGRKKKKKVKHPVEWHNYDPSNHPNIPLNGTAPPPPVRLTQDNFKDKSISQQKWGFEVCARRKHRAFYGATLDCKAGPACKNEPFYSVKWCSYNKTGKAAYAYGVKENFKWACPECADKWAKRNIGGKDGQYKLPELPEYPNPALKSSHWDGPPTVYDARFC